MERKPANLGVTIFIALIATLLVFFAFNEQKNTDKKQEELKDKIVEAVEDKFIQSPEYADFETLSSLKKLELVKNFETWTPNAKVTDEYVNQVIVREKGILSKAYLFVAASSKGKPLTRWESIYIKMNEVGGHLFRPDSLPIPNSDETQLLFALNDIPYLQNVPYSEGKIPFHANWFEFFRDQYSIKVLMFISSLQPALLNEVTLYYDCVDSQECLLSLK